MFFNIIRSSYKINIISKQSKKQAKLFNNISKDTIDSIYSYNKSNFPLAINLVEDIPLIDLI